MGQEYDLLNMMMFEQCKFGSESHIMAYVNLEDLIDTEYVNLEDLIDPAKESFAACIFRNDRE
ncbi:hypothetical protein AMTR_s00013p00070900 [Amborella trichopoda]|uniref:Uncharacterized protein n=1 Tax=Amborella trichopoda TaxID=13333 RepID=W1PIQ0_AMBTC|nr:hypothetical protein AMTR_s00013p00070900 [Amborella trichopoda]